MVMELEQINKKDKTIDFFSTPVAQTSKYSIKKFFEFFILFVIAIDVIIGSAMVAETRLKKELYEFHRGMSNVVALNNESVYDSANYSKPINDDIKNASNKKMSDYKEHSYNLINGILSNGKTEFIVNKEQYEIIKKIKKEVKKIDSIVLVNQMVLEEGMQVRISSKYNINEKNHSYLINLDFTEIKETGAKIVTKIDKLG